MKIKNVPSYAEAMEYIVYRVIDDEPWFYGAWNDFESAVNVAVEVDGYVFHNHQ